MNRILLAFLFLCFLGSCVPPGLLVSAEQKVVDLTSQINRLNSRIKDTVFKIEKINSEKINQINNFVDSKEKSNEFNKISIDTNQFIKNYFINTNKTIFDIDVMNLVASKLREGQWNIKANPIFFDLQKELKKYDNKYIYLKIDDNLAAIELSDNLFFNKGSWKLKKESLVVLDAIANVLLNMKNIQINVEGHTDNTSISSNNSNHLIDNLDLSLKRSAYVARLFHTEYMISSKNIIVSGRGEFSPVSANNNEVERQKNRRVRILIIPNK